MKIFIRLFFLFYFVVFTAGECFGNALPSYWADLSIDTAGAFIDSFLNLIAAHPFISAGFILSLVLLAAVHKFYKNKLAEIRWHEKYKNAATIYKLPFDNKTYLYFRLLKLLRIVLATAVIACFYVLVIPFYHNLSQELHAKKTKRDKIDYNAKTAQDAYKNTFK
ncbi:MAG: hypothetical protein FWG57_03990 [Endomicrobia bacterium]|nr:hypothetical protein [Endomicrobiia bacterium]